MTRPGALAVAALLTAFGPSTATVQPAYDDLWPNWSPDGRRLVFASTRDGDPEIYTIDADGTAATRLTTTPGRDAHPNWSPDGRQIAFQSPREGGHVRIFLMNADGSGQRAITSNTGFCGVPVWSPDGRHIAFQCTEDLARTGRDKPWQLFVVDAAGGAPRRLVTSTSNDQVPNWSPDGMRLVFYSDRTGVDQLYVVNASGGPPTQVTNTPAANRTASWSPDGRFLIFQSERAGTPSDIFRMASGGGEASRFTSFGAGNGVPFYSADGRTIAFMGPSGSSSRIWLMNADGSNQRPLAR